MTIATIHPSEVAAAIAAKTLTGITLKGPAAMVNAPVQGHLPLLQPAPKFISNLDSQTDSYGSGGIGQATATYNLGYRYLQAFSSSAGLGDVFDKLAQAVSALYGFFAENDVIAFTGGQAIDVRIVDISEFGEVTAPNNAKFWGFDLAVGVKELIN